MKAKYKEKFNRYTLSIGMIVKNEEKNLRACLEALEPLRKAVPSELIIVDTGSEDGTIEIAREFTENVYLYQWNNDFAAARNYGLDRATGQWFMYLDADEQLAAPEELISFFLNEKESKNYNTVQILVHSFLNTEYTRYSDFMASRIFRMNIGNRFCGAIHEVPSSIAPVKQTLTTRLDHYGYVYKTPEDKQKKYKRNNDLMEIELEKDPNNLRLISLYSSTCPNEKRLELLLHGRKFAEQMPEDYYFPEIYWRLSREYGRLGKYQEVLEVVEEYKKLTTGRHVGEVELTFNEANAFFQLSRYEEALDAYNEYIDLHNQYIDGSLIKQDNACDICERADAVSYNTIFLPMATCLGELKRHEEAFEILTKADLREIAPMQDGSIILNLINSIIFTNHFDLLIKAEEWVCGFQLPAEREKVYITNLVNIYLQKANDIKSDEFPKSDSFFSKIISLDAEGTTKEWEEIVACLKNSAADKEKYGAVALFQALRNGINPLSLLHSVKQMETIQKWNRRIAENAKNLEDFLLDYSLDTESEEDIVYRFWRLDLEMETIRRCRVDCRLPLAHRIVEGLSWYIHQLYNKEILTPKGICILPALYRFGFWCGQALTAKEQGDVSGYVKLLGEASHACPEMAEVSKLLVQEVRDNDEALKAKREQQELAQKIKGIIEGMIVAGNQADAQSILTQYELIAPNDPDIPALKAAILQQPTLSEI